MGDWFFFTFSFVHKSTGGRGGGGHRWGPTLLHSKGIIMWNIILPSYTQSSSNKWSLNLFICSDTHHHQDQDILLASSLVSDVNVCGILEMYTYISKKNKPLQSIQNSPFIAQLPQKEKRLVCVCVRYLMRHGNIPALLPTPSENSGISPNV